MVYKKSFFILAKFSTLAKMVPTSGGYLGHYGNFSNFWKIGKFALTPPLPSEKYKSRFLRALRVLKDFQSNGVQKSFLILAKFSTLAKMVPTSGDHLGHYGNFSNFW